MIAYSQDGHLKEEQGAHPIPTSFDPPNPPNVRNISLENTEAGAKKKSFFFKEIQLIPIKDNSIFNEGS